MQEGLQNWMIKLNYVFYHLQKTFSMSLLSVNVHPHAHINTFLLCQNRGAALLVEAANMGDPDAQYELGRRLRIEVSFLCIIIQLIHITCHLFQDMIKSLDQTFGQKTFNSMLLL